MAYSADGEDESNYFQPSSPTKKETRTYTPWTFWSQGVQNAVRVTPRLCSPEIFRKRPSYLAHVSQSASVCKLVF